MWHLCCGSYQVTGAVVPGTAPFYIIHIIGSKASTFCIVQHPLPSYAAWHSPTHATSLIPPATPPAFVSLTSIPCHNCLPPHRPCYFVTHFRVTHINSLSQLSPATPPMLLTCFTLAALHPQSQPRNLGQDRAEQLLRASQASGSDTESSTGSWGIEVGLAVVPC